LPTETLSPEAPTQLETAPAPAGQDDRRSLLDIRPPLIQDELRRGVLGQDRALGFVSVAVFKHTTGKVSGNILLIGNSGTGKTTIMNNIERLYHELPEYQPFRVMTILNANLLVDSERTEFRPDRIFSAVEQRARTILGARPSPEDLREAIERATICIDEVDKMTSVVAGKPNPIGVVLQQGLLTLMEGERLLHRTHAWVDGADREVTLEIDTGHMMWVCGGAFEGLYDQVYDRVTRPGSGAKLRSEAIRTATGQVRIETIFSLADHLKIRDLFTYGMVPQFMARFDKLVLLNDLSRDVLKEILLHSYDSPFVRSRRYFNTLGIDLEIEDLAAALIAEEAAKESRTGARALREIFTEIINPYEFDPWSKDELEDTGNGRQRLVVTGAMVQRHLG
jgi:ATP-dependent Clp protease ATP-binding subunit ClpX